MRSSPSPGSADAGLPTTVWSVEANRLRFGDRFSVAFHRTLRVPEDDQSYPLPPGLGLIPVMPVADLGDRAPPSWRPRDAVLVPLYQREALWLGFDGSSWHPSALTVAAGGINALTGMPAANALSADPQNYLVVPDQPWIDGFQLEPGLVRQFVAAPLGGSVTIAEQLGSADRTALRLRLFEAVPGRFPDREPPDSGRIAEGVPQYLAGGFEMGLAAGGRIVQRLYADTYGIDSWQQAPAADLLVYVVNSEAYAELTGRPTPATPVSAADYSKAGLPWFELYDEHRSPLATERWLHRLKTLAEADPTAATEPVAIDPKQVQGLHPK